MFEEKQWHEVCKEMRSVVTMDEVKEFIDLVQEMECKHNQKASDLNNACESEYIDAATREKMEEAIYNHEMIARKWNNLWAVFDHAEYHSVKS